MNLMYRHKRDGRMMTASTPWLWSLVFGGFYFLYRKAWMHSAIWLVAAVCTLGLAWLVYPFYAGKALTSTYKNRGWERVA